MSTIAFIGFLRNGLLFIMEHELCLLFKILSTNLRSKS